MNGRRVVLLGGLIALVVLSGTAFAHAFGGTMAFQQRDQLSVEQTNVALSGDTVTVEYAVENPLARSVTLYGVEMVVYEGEPPFDDGSELTVRRQAQVAGGDVQIDSGETAQVTVELPIASESDRVQAAIEAEDAVPSGLFQFRLGGREFLVEVVANG